MAEPGLQSKNQVGDGGGNCHCILTALKKNMLLTLNSECSRKSVFIVSSISVRICICEASLHIYINSHLPNYTKRESLIESFYNHIIYSM